MCISNITITYSDDDKSENEESDLSINKINNIISQRADKISINKINNIISQRADKILEEQKNHDNKIEGLKNEMNIIKKFFII